MAELIRASILDHGEQPSDIFSSFPSLSSALSSLRLYQRLSSLTNATKNASRKKELPRKICKTVSDICYPHPRATSLSTEVNALLKRSACTFSLRCPAPPHRGAPQSTSLLRVVVTPSLLPCVHNWRDHHHVSRAKETHFGDVAPVALHRLCLSPLCFLMDILHWLHFLVSGQTSARIPKHLLALLYHCRSFKYILLVGSSPNWRPNPLKPKPKAHNQPFILPSSRCILGCICQRQKSLIEAERRKSRRERRKAAEDVGRLLSMVKNGGTNELSHELIFSALRGLGVRLCIWGECYGASESTKRSDREWARIVLGHNNWYQSQVRVDGERKPILNSDQIRHAQKWRLSIPPDSSRRDEAPVQNRVKIGRQTHSHAPPEIFGAKALFEFSRHSGFIREVGFQRFCFYFGEVRRRSNLRAVIMLSDADYAPGKPRMRNEMNRKTIRQIRQCIGHECSWVVDQVEGDVPGEEISEQSLNEEACVETSERDYSGGTNERVLESHRKRSKEEAREEVSRRRSQRSGEEEGQEELSNENKAQDQSSEAATIAMMAVDENDVFLAASVDEKSYWISDSGIAYHLCRDREVFSAYVACEGLVRMANDAIVGKGQSGSAWQTGDP
ncbi:hypothetical protein Acr_00g0029660 [Actinidia rufa]|uniref:Uncharacterized protein n=1 Tax=Actinidia rufa TaxID=165716 RepID=A0A7J0DEK0_9ERIC|nr:hypothetical protein Acr_00g0029660 [Actinidia rufa]